MPVRLFVDGRDVTWIPPQSFDIKARYGEHLAEVVAEQQSKLSGETIEP